MLAIGNPLAEMAKAQPSEYCPWPTQLRYRSVGGHVNHRHIPLSVQNVEDAKNIMKALREVPATSYSSQEYDDSAQPPAHDLMTKQPSQHSGSLTHGQNSAQTETADGETIRQGIFEVHASAAWICRHQQPTLMLLWDSACPHVQCPLIQVPISEQPPPLLPTHIQVRKYIIRYGLVASRLLSDNGKWGRGWASGGRTRSCADAHAMKAHFFPGLGLHRKMRADHSDESRRK